MTHHALGRADGSALSFEQRSRPEYPRPSLSRSSPTDRGESAAAEVTIRSIAAFFPAPIPCPPTISKSLGNGDRDDAPTE